MNLKDSAKSRGVVVFAFNTDVDYVAIADCTSQLTAHTLGLPITLITDLESKPEYKYDTIVRIDNTADNFRTDLNDVKVAWKNFGRYLAYELSPYDETILLDTDYLVLDDSLLKLFETPFDYKLMHHNRNLEDYSYELMGDTSLPYVWATVVLFRRTERSRLFFNLIGRIQRNYRYYRNLYNIREGNYRNDYAFAIANNVISGYSLNEDQGIPWRMLTVDQKIDQIKLTNNWVQIYYSNKSTVVPHQCLHIMDKDYLQSENFKQVVEAVCEPT